MAAGGTYIPIATTTLSSSSATVTFSSIPGTYTDLVLIGTGGSTTSSMDMGWQANGDTGANYSSGRFYGTGSGIGVSASANQSGGEAGAWATNWGNWIINIFSYANTTTYKTSLSRTDNVGFATFTHGTTWANTAAITSLTLMNFQSRSFASGSVFTLYGIAAA